MRFTKSSKQLKTLFCMYLRRSTKINDINLLLLVNYRFCFGILLSIFYVQFIHFYFIISLLKITCFIIDAETTCACEKKRQGNTKDLEVIFMPTRSGKHTLEIRILDKVVVKEKFEIKPGLWTFFVFNRIILRSISFSFIV